jgi:membrane-associated protease RseP (regulator of RpoE activity)
MEEAMILATVSALLTLAVFPAGSPTVADSSPDETVVVDRQVLLDDDGDGQLIRIGDGDEPMVIGIGGRRGFIGIRLLHISEDLRKHYGASEDEGILVSEVEAESPAAKAGIQVGDVITRVDGDRVDSAGDLSRAVHDKKAGEKVRVSFLRDRRAQEVTVTVEEREGRPGRIRSFRMPKGRAWSYRMDPDRWNPMVLENLDELPRLQDRLKDLEKRLQELEKRLSAR